MRLSEPKFVYHLHIFSQCMPTFKEFFDSRKAAEIYLETYMETNFPYDDVYEVYKDDRNKFYELIDCAIITTIDTSICLGYKKLFKTGSSPVVKKYYDLVLKKEIDEDAKCSFRRPTLTTQTSPNGQTKFRVSLH